MNSDLPPPKSLTKTQQRFVPLLLDPATLHLSSKEMADKAGYHSRTSWLVALQDDAFRAWVEALKQFSPPVQQSPVADALTGRIPIEQGLSPTNNGFGMSCKTLSITRFLAKHCVTKQDTRLIPPGMSRCETQHFVHGYEI